MKRFALVFTVLIILAAAILAAMTAMTQLPGENMTPAGLRQSRSLSVRMHDGVEIAATVWLPPDFRQGQRVPVLMRTTRYWRSPKLGWGLRLLVAVGQVHLENLVDRQRVYFNRRHFGVIIVDARGSGASSGERPIEYAPAEVADMGEVAAWAAAQPWSNGQVETFGVSYDGNMAELAAATDAPAIRAVMPLYDDFDTQALIQPGGVPLRGFVEQWSDLVAALDRNDVCAAGGDHGWSCWWSKQVVTGVKPVDADPHGARLHALVDARHNPNVAKMLANGEFRDDSIMTAIGTMRFKDFSPYGLRGRIEASRVPMMVWCGWLDANPCEGALIRYRTFSNPQALVIGPLSHGGAFNVDPFAASHVPPIPTTEMQYEMETSFFERPDTITSSIRYYTMGEGAWHTTTVWPPREFKPERLYFTGGNGLGGSPPSNAAGAHDAYTVDFTASSGTQTRWHTQLGGGDVRYPDRASVDKKLLTYTSAPLDADLEITGSPILTLVMASTATDGAIHAYLEDVSPEGRVTYLDEGIFRLIHRKEVDPARLPYAPLGPAHSFLRSDAEPLTPGEPATIRFALFPTSVLLRKSHRIRIALAGADASLFQRIPAEGTPTWTVYRDSRHASFLELPERH